MPSPRASRGRDFTPGPPGQFDPTTDHGNAYQNVRRDRNRLAGDKLRATRRTKSGWAVEPRNGLPVRLYPICNACGARGHYEMGHADA